MSQMVGLLERLRPWAARHRVVLNRVAIVLLLLFVTHPRNHVFFFFGLAVAFAGSLLRLWARLALLEAPGRFQSQGPYELVRHPLYLGTILQALGLWVACFGFRKIFSFVLFGLMLAAYFFFIYKEAILLEEEDSARKWPKEWDDYMARTPALIPEGNFLERIDFFHFKFSTVINMNDTGELRNFAACLGLFSLLWLKLVYRL